MEWKIYAVVAKTIECGFEIVDRGEFVERGWSIGLWLWREHENNAQILRLKVILFAFGGW